MEKVVSRVMPLIMVILLSVGMFTPMAYASEEGDATVKAVIEQLEAIDTLQEMQDERSKYPITSRYNIDTTDTALIAKHEAARAGYETYVSRMFAARVAAQQAYDALTTAQQAQIPAALVAKLSGNLPTVLKAVTASVTPRNDEYSFEAVKSDDMTLGYEVSNHMISGQIAQTFILVDTAGGATSWTPSGKYTYGKSNYDVAYCCDVKTGLKSTTHYKRINLEDSNYYGAVASQHIRAILQNAYPFVTIDEMKASLKAGGLSADFVDELTRADLIAAVQMAVWSYANADDGAAGGLGYFASFGVPENIGSYFNPLHDYTNECWDWFSGEEGHSYDPRAEYRVNMLAYYLCSLPGVAPQDDQVVISNVEVTRAELIPGVDDTYSVGMYIYLNDGGNENDQLKISATSYQVNGDGTIRTTGRVAQNLGGRSRVELTVKAKVGDTIKVVVEGTQKLGKGVYFYEPEGGRDVSQCLVGVAEGETNVRAEREFVFVENVWEKGLRIYKTEGGTSLPLSDITFSIYKVVPGAGESLSEVPTAEELDRYMIPENMVASVTTDETGYASTELEDGTYLVVEEHNAEKVKAPVEPFYITVPMITQDTENGDSTTAVEMINIVSVYPKNETVPPPEEPPIIPPTPDKVTGRFEILKHDAADESDMLSGAKFAVYRAATAEDAETETIVCKGVQYAVVPVVVDGSQLILTTDKNGWAISPDLNCGLYYLVETKAPAGYNMLEEAVSVSVTSSVMTEVTTIRIANQRGHLLPETGGEGREWFWRTGVILMAGAGVLLVTKRRMRIYE